jgi:hypothetical protein
MGVKMSIFYNFDNMYNNRKDIASKAIKNIDTNKYYIKDKDTIISCIPNKEIIDIVEDEFKLDMNVALFDYSTKATSSYLTNQGCTNANCFGGLLNQETPDNCIDYNGCLQYFNTMQIVNCIDNVPAASFLVLDDL